MGQLASNRRTDLKIRNWSKHLIDTTFRTWAKVSNQRIGQNIRLRESFDQMIGLNFNSKQFRPGR